MNNNYKIIRTIFENVFQRVAECKDDETGDVFYSNIITSQKVINLINISELKFLSSNILEAYNTDDRIYIFTKPLNLEYKGLKESVENLTLKQQFSLSEKVILLAQNIFNMTDVVQQKILDLDRVFVDDNNNLHVDLNLIFEQEYDIADNETFKRLGNILHYIFSGTEIIDYNISDSIPPDILKIIVRCLTREYTFPKDVLDEMKESPIYAMIFGSEIIDSLKYNINTTEQELDLNSNYKEAAIDSKEEDDSVLNIYLNRDKETEKPTKNNNKFSNKEVLRIVVSLLIVVIVLLVGNKLIKMFNARETSNNNPIEQTENNKPVEPMPTNPEAENENQTPVTEITDSTEIYFNEELLTKVGYEGPKAEVDSNIYLEGKNSLLVKNDGDDTVKKLFAVVDFTDEKFSYMLKQQIGIVAKVKSENDVDTLVVLEAYKNGVLASNFHTKLSVYNDIWSPLTVPINVTNADYLNIYLEYEGQNKVWIDAIYIDVIK